MLAASVFFRVSKFNYPSALPRKSASVLMFFVSAAMECCSFAVSEHVSQDVHHRWDQVSRQLRPKMRKLGPGAKTGWYVAERACRSVRSKFLMFSRSHLVFMVWANGVAAGSV